MPWNIVQTYPNASLKAFNHLRRQDFEPFSPICATRVHHRGKFKWRVASLFPGYMFVRCENRWRALLSTVGVLRLLMIESEKPATVPDSFVADITARQNEFGLVDLTKSKFYLGQGLTLRSGAVSTPVIFDGQKDRDRVYVLLSFLGSLRRVEVNEADLVAVD